MFIVLAHTAEYLEAKAACDAAKAASDAAALDAACGLQGCSCPVSLLRGLRDRRGSPRLLPGARRRPGWRRVAYVFQTLNGSPGGNLAIYAGDNGWSLVNSAPGVVLGFFATVDEIRRYCDGHGFGYEPIVELEPRLCGAAGRVERSEVGILRGADHGALSHQTKRARMAAHMRKGDTDHED